MTRWILHVDMDEFFAAVEKLDHPDLRGKCLLIGGDPNGRGVVATASYEARKFGCHSAMPMSQALRLCPHAIILPVRMERYKELSDQVFAVLERVSPVIEPLSIDEAFLDVTASERLLGNPPEIARQIKQTLQRDLGLTASLGVAQNKFLAKLASDLKKPDGLVVITSQNVQHVLDPLPVSRLWGAGPATVKAFGRLGIETIGQVRSMPLDVLTRAFGPSGEHFWKLANGIDERPVVCESQAKSIGQEETFRIDIADMGELRRVLLGQAQQVARRLREAGLMARTVTLKLRDGAFATITRSASGDRSFDSTETLWQLAAGLLEQWAATQRKPLRLLGLTASNLRPRGGQQLGLFDQAQSQKQQRLDSAVDSINNRFGRGIIGRAGSRTREQSE